ncbi:MAG: protease complex subunit PrcB family protein [candidate division WOR-3 bacterium]
MIVLALFTMAKPNPISWEEVASGYMSGVFESKAVWYDTTYKELLDTASDNVVLVFLGRRPSGGFGIKVKEVKTDGKKIYITAYETCPKPDEMVIQVITSPFAAIRLDINKKLPLELKIEGCKK